MPITPPHLSYNPANWYWKVGDKSPGTQVYSSAADDYVLLDNVTYVAWLASGGKTTPIDTEQNLADVLILAGQPQPPTSGTSDGTKNSLFDAVPQVVKVWSFAIDNRVRLLEGQPTRTAAQFKTYVKSLLS